MLYDCNEGFDLVQPPFPKARWDGVLDVRKQAAECVQKSDSMVPKSEDCLFIKIFTSSLPKKSKNLPVMVWIYGGAFFAGASDFNLHAPDYLLDEDVIIASFHYRTGIFGFLSTGDQVAPGNAGLKDQLLALKWIKDNINNFGGDPERITIFGQSAGAASVGYLLQNEQAKGLFSRAILQSGSPLCQWALSRVAKQTTTDVAKKLKVGRDSSARMVKEMKTLPANELQEKWSSELIWKIVTKLPLRGLPLGPVIEPKHSGAVITDNSYDLLKKGKFHHVPILMGHTTLEISADAEQIPGVLKLILLIFDLQPSKLVPVSLNMKQLIKSSLLGRKIKDHYFNSKSTVKNLTEAMEYASVDQFVRPIRETARLYSKYTPVYLYTFAHEGPLWGVYNRTSPGVAHTEDLGYLFDFKHDGSSVDYQVRHRMTRMWANFAKTGNPTPEEDELLGTKWIPNTSGDSELKTLVIDKALHMETKIEADELSFWDDIFKTYGTKPYSTY
ncbi:unnamed protein product [Acanthoscelides obtectus]|uniref:Carboxylic ester hydrolase n=1 Tax=Acanthoscelides obtectus TaxID=200917 RepID=A0A9P0PD94_ACAOB|nr:unnamed protein product [Acanthoscelides obtectus]CAK1660522.1 Acetylcholinesterase [Acanthoscelides obtectus]